MTHQYKKLRVTMNMWMQFNVMPRTQMMGVDYWRKKQMSAKIFKYFINADQLDLGVTVDPQLQTLWWQKIKYNSNIKLDNISDSLLHCLYAILCTSNYQQLVTSAISLHANHIAPS